MTDFKQNAQVGNWCNASLIFALHTSSCFPASNVLTLLVSYLFYTIYIRIIVTV